MIEHEAVLKPMAYLEENGYEVTYLPVDENGVISLDELKQALRTRYDPSFDHDRQQ